MRGASAGVAGRTIPLEPASPAGVVMARSSQTGGPAVPGTPEPGPSEAATRVEPFPRGTAGLSTAASAAARHDRSWSTVSTPDEQNEIVFRSDVTVELVRGHAADSDVVFAARVSTQGEQTLANVDADASKSAGLINFLMRDRHGSPFEHNSMTFYIEAPILVFREFMRHRIASYN